MHTENSPLSGKIVRIKKGVKHFEGSEFRVEDWWDHLTGKSWMNTRANPACIIYSMRTSGVNYPTPRDDEVLYGKIGSCRHLVHISEIEEI